MSDAAPNREGLLDVGDGQRVWWSEFGDPHGIPVLVVHGGPGGGSLPSMRHPYDPWTYRVVLFDQRGTGRSTPHASDPDVSLETNTTWHLVADMERLRRELGIDRWVLSGSSWGTTLALAYAQTHPDRVLAMILRSVTTFRASELDWVYRDGANHLLPERWEEFVAPIPPEERDDLVAGYRRRLESGSPEARIAVALAWTRWETAGMLSAPDPFIEDLFAQPRFALAFARIESHYTAHRAFLREGQLISGVSALAGLPAILIQGRHDLCTPPVTAWDLHRAWPGSELHLIEGEGHRLNSAAAVFARATESVARRLGGSDVENVHTAPSSG
jgi:proline iminopeptidase